MNEKAPLKALVTGLPQNPDPDRAQRFASDPAAIAWVNASAGSGKTKVLTDRVLRLLLPDPDGRWPGTPPHRLLCITFTKAGAAEMALRVQKRLSRWAIVPESELAAELATLCDTAPSQETIQAARRLFAEVLDSPGGLRILTIHAFCQSVLGRFPLEAGIVPNFQVIEPAQADDLFSASIDSVLLSARAGGQKDTAEAFAALSPYCQLEDLRKEIQAALKESDSVLSFAGKTDSLDSLCRKLRSLFGYGDVESLSALDTNLISRLDRDDLRRIALDVSASSLKTLKDMGAGIAAYLERGPDEAISALPLLYEALLTKSRVSRVIPASFQSKNPELHDRLSRLQTTLEDGLDQTLLFEQFRLTASLFLLAREILSTYDAEKKRLGVLDFDDLILKTEKLLAENGSAWVHFKLDGGIDHILMDEAQDTSARQWSILDRLREEIFSGAARESNGPRSLFVVGDEKQSIFRFQGADPEGFFRMKQKIRSESEALSRDFRDVRLQVSFRSSPPVLKLVDQVFASDLLRRRLGTEGDDPLKHYSRRSGDAGLVELWPLLPKDKEEKREDWMLPLPEDITSGPINLAGYLADEIATWIESGERLEAAGRPLEPGDILVLVRSRTGFVHELIRRLKQRNIPVTGIDRMILTDQIGVQDCLALARFSRLPADDFSLACLLKSPLIGWDDEALMESALQRGEKSLWQSLLEGEKHETVAWLQHAIQLATTASPFDFFETLLGQTCPGYPDGTGWQAMTARLGKDVLDPLQELLSLCLALEDQGIRTLDDLIVWQEKNRVEIKREMEDSASQIRIMTVHAAKGLEAPVVILPDTLSCPARGRIGKLIWPSQGDLPGPLWAPSREMGSRTYLEAGERVFADDEAEYARLLYVALTRARDRLYVMGQGKPGKSYDGTWYAMIEAGFNRLDGVETLPDSGRRRLYRQQDADTRLAPVLQETPPMLQTPDWLHCPPAPDPEKPRKLIPSTEAADRQLPAFSPGNTADLHRIERGRLTHTLFQFLPDIPDSGREDAAAAYLRRAGRALPEEVRAAIARETLEILRDPVFAPVFAPGSLAEVPITGEMLDGRLISGQIDRLVITSERILIVDFKTNRPSPESIATLPGVYREQLRSYRDALARIYPNLLINCAILWTERPLLMPVPL